MSNADSDPGEILRDALGPNLVETVRVGQLEVGDEFRTRFVRPFRALVSVRPHEGRLEMTWEGGHGSYKADVQVERRIPAATTEHVPARVVERGNLLRVVREDGTESSREVLDAAPVPEGRCRVVVATRGEVPPHLHSMTLYLVHDLVVERRARHRSGRPTRTFTVIGLHDGGRENRFAGVYEAADPTEAEEMALSDHPALLVAGVAEGAVRMVDDPARRDRPTEKGVQR
ncbi:MAG TPA: hypothetical protein VHA80_05490 [Solirubrobacterales bacterium]|nr:hypothetical protein [Solirubrobacterales bacterium]